MSSDALKATPEQAERLHSFAHDIRNRLAAMQQAMRMTAEPDPGPDAKELLDFAEQQFYKAMRQVECLLDDLEVDRSTGSLTTTSLDLAKVIDMAIKGQKNRTERKEQRVHVDVPENIRVMADAETLERLVSALLSNASKFSGHGSTIAISVALHAERVHMCVTDQGVGLDASDLQHIFERYAWLTSKSTAGEEQGRSALSRAFHLAQAMGGELSADSAGPGQGSTFTLDLARA
jgi:K+-sensing histidine kinase KdpD